MDRDFYLALADKAAQSILDLGCGTGLLCDAYAQRGHDVTGVDPAAAMLAVARRKPHGQDIEWVQSPAQDFKSTKLFDLIIMTGHAFQVLLEDEEIEATFSVMGQHLKPDGTIVFESRNPTINWAAQWHYDMVLETANGPVQESRRLLSMTNDRMQFELRYQFPDETLTSVSVLRFSSLQEIEERLRIAGLTVEKVLGDWNGSPFDATASEEMIFFVRKAN